MAATTQYSDFCYVLYCKNVGQIVKANMSKNRPPHCISFPPSAPPGPPRGGDSLASLPLRHPPPGQVERTQEVPP